jgi:hypothetical protein
MGGIEQERDTVMHISLMDGKKKREVISNIKEKWKCRVVMANTFVTACMHVDIKEWFHRSYALVYHFVSPREVVQWLSRVRHLIAEQVYVTKIPTLLPNLITNIFKDEEVFTRLVAYVNTEPQNNDQGALECFVLDVGYVIK